MNGAKYLFDTNAVIKLLQENNSPLFQKVNTADWLGISIITYLEFLSFPDILKEDIELLIQFTNRIDVINLDYDNTELMEIIITLRKKYNIKLPDAIIAGTAITLNAILNTADKQLMNIRELPVLEC